MQVTAWTLRPNQTIRRVELHRLYGGRSRGGIGPSAKSPNVLVFTDRKVDLMYGYSDGWQSDGRFHYTGEGQHGDQLMKQGNAAILGHKRDGRALRLFERVGGIVRYMGEFAVDEGNPWYTTSAPEVDSPVPRNVIVFRMRPIDVPAPSDLPTLPVLPDRDVVDEVEVEAKQSERMVADPTRAPYEAARVEAVLVHDFRAYCETRGHSLRRHRITPAGEAKPIFTDGFLAELNQLIEAKGTTERNALIMAIGQLIDYGRFLPSARRALPLPTVPRADLCALLRVAQVDFWVRSQAGFGLHRWDSVAP